MTGILSVSLIDDQPRTGTGQANGVVRGKQVPQRVARRSDDCQAIVGQVAGGVERDHPVTSRASPNFDDTAVTEGRLEGMRRHGGRKENEGSGDSRRYSAQRRIDVADKDKVTLGQPVVCGQAVAKEILANGVTAHICLSQSL